MDLRTATSLSGLLATLLLASTTDLPCRAGAGETTHVSGALAGERPRVIVSTDIGGSDNDDYQSMVHFLVYADVLEVEGLLSSPPGAGRAANLHEVIDAYEQDFASLRRHSSEYPPPDRLRALVKQGAAVPAPSQGFSTATEGSRWLIERALIQDARPLYVLVWGSITDVAQAVHDEQAIKKKLRVYSIGSWNTHQDRAARDYLFQHHPDLWWIETNTTFRGMYVGGKQVGDLDNRIFVDRHVRGYGALGRLLADKLPAIKMGDTPSVLYLLWGDADDPTGEHWGGSFVSTGHAPHYWTDSPDPALAEGRYPGAKTVNMWREAYLRDWQARMLRTPPAREAALPREVSVCAPHPPVPMMAQDEVCVASEERPPTGSADVGGVHSNASDSENTLLRAFPQAEGFGACTQGGRGGKVYYVTTLDDYLPGTAAPVEGSLRAAVEAEGPRLVLFRVGGTISLKADLWVRKPFLTIAGQTAPGDGICIKDYMFVLAAHDIVIRHMRFRSGDLARKEQIAVGVFGGNNCILDHCSMSWATDEVMSTFGAYNFTAQWCIIAEGLSHSYHPKGEHSKGSIIDGTGGITIHHCIYAHNAARNPRVNTVVLDFRNNVLYNWGYRAGYTTEAPCFMNYVANYLKPGPSTRETARTKIFEPGDDMARVFLRDNFLVGYPEHTANNVLLIRSPKSSNAEATTDAVVVREPFPSPEVLTDLPETAFARVLAEAGAVRPRRDSADSRLVEEIRTGTGRIVNSPADVGGWPVLAGAPAAPDSDYDGMPDAWEKQHGFDSTQATDGNEDADGDGYTNVEEFLNSTAPRVPDMESRVNAKPFRDIQQAAIELAAEGRRLFAERKARVNADYEAHKTAMKKTLKVQISPSDVLNAKRIVLDIDGKASLALVRIPAGHFLMGSPENEGGEDNEHPQHRVNISRDFFMAETPTTARQFWAVMGDVFGKIRPGEEEHSAHEVNWPTAGDYCDILSAVTGYRFRLPTEAEWEYACRAGTTTAFHTGDTITSDQANFDATQATRYNPAGASVGKKRPVRSYPPNAWGLYDMHGNDAEYCLDSCFRTYTEAEVTDPVYLEGGVKVLRGGRATSKAFFIRSAYRYGYAPEVGYAFRIVMEVPQE